MIDRGHIGRELYSCSVTVEAGRLRLFAKAIGEDNPIHLEEGAARAAGFAALPVPPTFLCALELEQDAPNAWFETVGLRLDRVLHGEQTFVYHHMLHAGDTVTLVAHIVDIYEKNGGALEFVVKGTAMVDQRGRRVADLRSVIIQRNPVCS